MYAFILIQSHLLDSSYQMPIRASVASISDSLMWGLFTASTLGFLIFASKSSDSDEKDSALTFVSVCCRLLVFVLTLSTGWLALCASQVSRPFFWQCIDNSVYGTQKNLKSSSFLDWSNLALLSADAADVMQSVVSFGLELCPLFICLLIPTGNFPC